MVDADFDFFDEPLTVEAVGRLRAADPLVIFAGAGVPASVELPTWDQLLRELLSAEVILDGDRETAVALLLWVGELAAATERLGARVAELERRLRRSWRNSSLPPSQDPPSAPPRPGGRPSGRRRGGQLGHEGRHRRLLALDRVDEVVEHWPERCHACAYAFAETDWVDAAEPSRHQVAELPPIAVRVPCPAQPKMNTFERPRPLLTPSPASHDRPTDRRPNGTARTGVAFLSGVRCTRRGAQLSNLQV